MTQVSRRMLILSGLAALAACSANPRASSKAPAQEVLAFGAGESPEMRTLIDRYADEHGVPRSLVHRVVQRESRYNPRARNGSYYGLMQISPQTAGTMGFRGQPSDLLDAETNLKYGVKYLRGAWLVSDGSHDKAVSWYSRGYYYEAKRRGLLRETGLRS